MSSYDIFLIVICVFSLDIDFETVLLDKGFTETLFFFFSKCCSVVFYLVRAALMFEITVI